MTTYNAESIEVLSGLEPVRRRPGMYTDTTRPNHLVQEVVDNSVDEAMAGHADRIEIVLAADGGVRVTDNGRGMPVDIHPEHGVPGIELILTRLHAGGKFSGKNYKFSGGLHGVGVSVVNALSTRVEVQVKKDGNLYQMGFANGNVVEPLAIVDSVAKRARGTVVTFWPDVSFFDSPNYAIKALKHLLRAKAVLCPGLTIDFKSESKPDDNEVWCFQSGLLEYLSEALGDQYIVPEAPFVGQFEGKEEAVDWALTWLPEGGDYVTESYVNLVPTALGGTHVNGLRTGLTDALREYCEFRSLLPKGLKLAPEDLWDRCAYVISVKMDDPQFAGQTKERLSSRSCAPFVSGVVKDAFSLYLNTNPQVGDALAELAISAAQSRLKARKKVARKRITQGPALPGKLADCSGADSMNGELFLVEGDSAGGSAKQARDREFQAVMPLRGKILNTWEVDSSEILASQEVHDIAVAIGVDPASENLDGLRYGKVCILADADSDGAHIATLLCALFCRHFPALVKAGHVYVAMPPLYRIDAGKDIYYALDEDERVGVMDRIQAEKRTVKIGVTRFKGLGEMNPLQLRETVMDRDTRRLIQLVMDDEADAHAGLDLLLSKKRSADRREWLESSGHLADLA